LKIGDHSLEDNPETLPDMPQNIPEELPRSKRILRELFEIAQMLLLAAVLYFAIDAIIGRERVQKISMEPTFDEGEILMVNKLAYKLGDFNYGQVITFHYPLDPKLDYIKRVIGLPGDVVDVYNGEVRINGRLLYEPYISAAPEYEGTWVVPEDELFVLGDNRNPSADSHVWGFVPEENVIGKAIAVYWPVNRIRAIITPDIFAH
jgi:signal peptidase I